MTDTETAPASTASSSSPSSDGESPLASDQGRTDIANSVVAKVAGIATREVGGVYDVGSSATRAIGSVTQAVGISDERTQGVTVEVGEKQAAVDVSLVIEYGESIPRIAAEVRKNVGDRIEGITGLEVTEVNIEINDLHFPADDQQQQQQQQQEPASEPRVA